MTIEFHRSEESKVSLMEMRFYVPGNSEDPSVDTVQVSNVIFDMFYSNPPRGARNPAFTQIFCTNQAQKFPEIHVHAMFTQSP